MFYPLFKLLYLISRSIFRLIDALLLTCKSLCGIQEMTIGEQSTDFLTFLLNDSKVGLGFRVSLVLGVVLVTVFAIAAIIRTITHDKVEGTPAQIAVKAAKTVLEFLFVPFVMIVIIGLTNVFVSAIYEATSVTDSPQLGTLLAGICSQDGLKEGVDPYFYLEPGFDYTDTGTLFDYVEYTEFDYFLSWITGIGILFALAASLMSFVDRAISIALLFIVSPISISTSMIDEGAHFKLWRDQILVKFLTGYGTILGINLYAILIAAVSNPAVVMIPDWLIPPTTFLSASFLNYIVKLVIIVGGAYSLQRIMALIGNLVQAGAGSNELREANMAASSAGRGILGTLKAPFKIAKAGRAVHNFASDAKRFGVGDALARSTGFRTERDYRRDGWFSEGGKGGGSGSNQNTATPNNGNDNKLSGIISGDNNSAAGQAGNTAGGTPGTSNQNSAPVKKPNTMVNDLIKNGTPKKK